jgi:hypothetical protein
MSELEKKLKFIEKTLPKLIVEENEEFKGQSVVRCSAKANSQLDGFVSDIFLAEMVLER